MKKVDYFIKKYLENRPMFMAIIRSQESMIFQEYNNLVKKKVLDFGCGDGFFANLVFGKSKINVGLDLFDNKRIKEAKKENIYKKIALYDGNIIPYSNNYFNTVVSNCVLEHIPNIKFSLKEIHRVLKPGGYFLTSVMTDRWEDYFFGSKIFGKAYVKYMRKVQAHHNLLSNKQWQLNFRKAGFKVQSIDGYLYRKDAFYLDLFHYISLPSLLSYKLWGKWVLFSIPFLNNFLIKFFKNIIKLKDDCPAAYFFVLKKI